MHGRAESLIRSTWAWGALLAIVTWPDALIAPQASGDFSTYVGLHMATGRGLDFGHDIIWTYGPLGFLRHPRLVTGPLFTLDFLYTAGVRLALATLLVRALRRTLPLPAAVLVAWPVAAVSSAQRDIALGVEPEVAVVTIVALEVLRAPPDSWLRRTYPIAAGVATGLFALVKFDIALFALAAGAVAVWATRREGRWRIPGFLASGLGCASVLWLAMGQEAPVDYVATGLSISQGYSSALSYEQPGFGWQLPAAAAAAAIILAAALSETQYSRRPSRPAVLVLLLLVGFLAFKEGFVRHDDYHAQIFFPSALAVAATFTWSRRRAQPLLLSLVALGGFALAADAQGLRYLLRPSVRVRAFLHSAKVVVSRNERVEVAAQARRAIAATAPISPALLKAVGRATVTVLPRDQSYVWAYRLNWRPLPVLQLLAAYTRKLDEANREFLASSQAPRFLLDQGPVSIEARNGQWDSPAAMVEVLCRYRSEEIRGGWALLVRRGSRCGRPRPMATVHASTGQIVPVPPAFGALVVVRIRGLDVHGLERVRAFLYRARQRRVALDGGRRFRMVPDTAADGLLLQTPPGIDYPAPFSLSPQARTITTSIAGTGPQRITYEFVAVPVSLGPAARGSGSSPR